MADVTLTVDGKKITAPAGTLLLEACKAHGIEIPAFCYYPGLSLQAACRMCVVRIEKVPKLQTACTTPVAEGMVVITESPEIAQARKATLQLLLGNLNGQLAALEDPWAVEIRINRDGGEKPVGVKRNELLAVARGRYVVFIDDDDQVAPDYMADILAALARQPGVDCVVFAGELTVDSHDAGPFDFGLEHRHYYQQDGVYYRTPNHLCPVKRTLALATGFPAVNRGEDTDYAVRLYPQLQSQAVVRRPATSDLIEGSGRPGKKTLYFYHFSTRGTKTQKPIT